MRKISISKEQLFEEREKTFETSFRFEGTTTMCPEFIPASSIFPASVARTGLQTPRSVQANREIISGWF